MTASIYVNPSSRARNRIHILTGGSTAPFVRTFPGGIMWSVYTVGNRRLRTKPSVEPYDLCTPFEWTHLCRTIFCFSLVQTLSSFSYPRDLQCHFFPLMGWITGLELVLNPTPSLLLVGSHRAPNCSVETTEVVPESSRSLQVSARRISPGL